MDAAKRGADALSAGQAEKAVEHYTSAISQLPEAADYYIQRSTAYRRLKQSAEALADAEAAVCLANKRARRELIAKAQLERGIVLYGLERFGDSKQCFAWSEEYNPNEKRIGIWNIKIDEKLKALPAGDGQAKVSVDKMPKLDLDKVKDAAKPTPAPISTPAQSAAATLTPANKIRHDWYQSPDTVTVNLMAKNVPKDKARIDMELQSLSISFPLPTGSDFDFSVEPLFGKIDASTSSYKIMSTKIEVILKKATPGVKWAKLEGDAIDHDASADDLTAKTSKVTVDSAPAYPTSSRSGPKNWDKVVSDIRESERPAGEKGGQDDDDDIEGDQVNGFFKQIYKNSDPDTRRAMMKSYTESNGTALSTNWSEVSTKTFATDPPDGMEAKKW